MSGRVRQHAAAPSAAYDQVARALHWLVAVLAVVVVSLGWAIAEAPRNTDSRALLVLLHGSVGLAILALMVLRGGWRLFHPPPPLPASLARIEALLAHANHLGLYLILVLMPLAGYLSIAAAGQSVGFFGIAAIPPLVPENERLSQLAIALHLAGQFLLYALVAMHIAAALVHAILWRNGILERMLPGRRPG